MDYVHAPGRTKPGRYPGTKVGANDKGHTTGH
jgi:hypothetical protein